MSLRWRLTLLVIGTILPLAILAGISSYYLSRVYDDTNATRLLQLARSVLAAVESRFDIATSTLQVLATAEELARDDFVAFEKHARGLMETLLPAANVVLANADGFPLVNTAIQAPRPLNPDVAKAVISTYREVFETGRVAVSPLFYGTLLRRHAVRIVVPVFRNGTVVYVLGASISSETLSELINQVGRQDWTLAIWDRNNTVLARNRDWEKYVGHQASSTILPALSEKRDQLLVTTTFDGVRVQTAVVHSPQFGFSLGIGVPESIVTRPRNEVLIFLAAVSLLCLLISALLASRLASQVLSADRHRDVLMEELNHRERNLLATIQGIAAQTKRSSVSKDESWNRFDERILALAIAHESLTSSQWRNVKLGELIEASLRPFGSLADSIKLAGDELVSVDAKTATSVTLALNELATNALKYGALSVPDGTVELSWLVDHPSGELRLKWVERGGPPVERPKRKGFGTVLIEKGLGQNNAARIEFAATGVVCEMSFEIGQSDVRH